MTTDWDAVAVSVALGETVDLEFDTAVDPIDATVDTCRAVFYLAGVNSYYGIAEDSGAWTLQVAQG